MSWRRSLVAALVYATIMTGWRMMDDDPVRGSYVLGFAIYFVVFGVFFHLLMNWLDSRKRADPE